MAKINIRSPYFVNVSYAGLTSAKLELYIYTGTQTTNRGSIDYTLNSTAYNEEVTFEISELVRDYLDVTFNGSYDSQMVWVDYQVTEYVGASPYTLTMQQLEAFNGYGYFEDGVNPQLSDDLLQSNTIQYILKDEVLKVPVNVNDIVDVKFYNGATLSSTVSCADTTDSSSLIKYASDVANIDRVVVDNGTTTTEVNVEVIEECKHTPHKITFVNKFGVLQDVWFFKRSNLSLSTKKETYKSNISNSGSYSVNDHQTKVLSKQGAEKLVLNSGFVVEQYNEVFKQLMLSEKVWINYEAQTLPINISTSSLSYKTSLNDKMINYTIEVDFAFDKINSVR